MSYAFAYSYTQLSVARPCQRETMRRHDARVDAERRRPGRSRRASSSPGGCATDGHARAAARPDARADRRRRDRGRAPPTGSARCRWRGSPSELGVGTMSLYRYVAAKDELLTLMVDTALGPPPPLPDDGERMARRPDALVRRAARRLPAPPWSLRVPISAPAARAQQRRLARARAGSLWPTRRCPSRTSSRCVLLLQRVRPQRRDA